MKRTNFYEIHKGLGGKLVNFAGYEMPVQYSKGILHEHMSVRNAVGMFDVSHMGEVEVRGADALAFIQKITINDASKLVEGKAQYSAMCYEDGGIVDDLLVYHCGDYYMLVINASNIDKDLEWMQRNAAGFASLELKNVSDEINLLAVQGPKSRVTLQKLTENTLDDIEFYAFQAGKLAGVDMIISRTGYTGVLGFELYFRGDVATSKKVWDAIVEAGAEFNLEPVGLGARDTLRLEKGYALYGNDIDKTTNPIEAGLGWITKVNKGEFNGRDSIVAMKENGATRKLTGLKVRAEKFLPRHGYKVTVDGQEVGYVTSGSISPILNIGIAMAYINKEYAEPGAEVTIVGRKEAPAEVVKPPFVV